MRLASYNVESLFDRPKAMNPLDWSVGREALQRHARINELFEEPVYTDAVKDEIKDLLTQLGLAKADDGGKFARLRQNRGNLIQRNPLRVVADGRDSWVGWVDLEREPVDVHATRHTAMVIRDVDAHVMAVIEADHRIALREFSKVMPALFKKVTAAGVFRKGVWGGKNGTLFPHYDTMKKQVHQASDHAALFADIAI